LIEDATRFLALVEKGAGWEPGLVGLLLLLRAASPGDVARTVARLALAGKPREALARAPELAGLAARLEAASRPSEARTILAGLPLEAAVAALILAPGERARRLAVEYLSIGRFVRAELDGHDLAELGFAPGPVVGRILAALLDAKLDGEVADRPAEEAWVQARYRPPHGEALS
jgi:hypothetical protein